MKIICTDTTEYKIAKAFSEIAAMSGLETEVLNHHEAYALTFWGVKDIDGIKDKRIESISSVDKVEFMEYSRNQLHNDMVERGWQSLNTLFHMYMSEKETKDREKQKRIDGLITDVLSVMPLTEYNIIKNGNNIHIEQKVIDHCFDANDLKIYVSESELILHHISFEDCSKDEGRGTKIIDRLITYATDNNIDFLIVNAFEPVQRIVEKLCKARSIDYIIQGNKNDEMRDIVINESAKKAMYGESLGEILTKYFGKSFSLPESPYCKSYSALTSLLADVGALTGKDMNETIDELDKISNENALYDDDGNLIYSEEKIIKELAHRKIQY